MERRRISAFLALTGLLPIYALPITNTTNGVEPAYVSGPTRRGTIGLLWSCVVTFTLCTWTAVHPNIIPNQTDLGRNINKLAYMFTAAFFPECVVSVAFIEWMNARKIYEECQKMGATDMSKERCFFVVMGGITVDIENTVVIDGVITESVKTCVIKPDEFIEYWRGRHIGNDIFEKQTMDDKGNSSYIAKLLVCVQVSWLIIECVARKVAGLPITLLEIHVVIQVVFTVVMFGFWWNKPLDVKEPIRLPIQKSGSMNRSEDNICAKKPSITTCMLKLPIGIVLKGMDVRDQPYTILQGLGFRKSPFLYDSFQLRWAIVFFGLLNGAMHMAAWNAHFPTPEERWLWRVSSLAAVWTSILSMPWVQIFLINGGYIDLSLLDSVWEGWSRNEDFRSLANLNSGPGGSQIPTNSNSGQKKRVWGWLFGSAGLIMVGYCVSMLFLMVESLISCRNVPEGSYSTPSWTGLWPHI